MRKSVFRVSGQVGHKSAVQPQKMAGGLKFRIYEEEGFFYRCSKTKALIR